jgi:transmembrane sensor
MNLKQAENKLRPQVRKEATEWFVAFCEDEVDAPGRESFDRWLRGSPEHVRAYLQISALWESTGLLVDSSKIDVDALVQRAVSERNNVLALAATQMPANISSARRTSSRNPTASPAWRAIAACLLLVCAIGGGVWWQLMRTPVYKTGAAEQRTVRLPDGSTVQLNARSRVELHFTPQERAVNLIQGQAMFSVASNPRRPFIVRSNVAQVRAVGTRFDVYRRSRGTVVTVVEGQVAIQVDGLPNSSVRNRVSAPTEPASSVLVSAGEQTVATLRAPIHAYRTNVYAATAWTEGKLMFDSAPLKEVVAEFNRIGSRRLSIEDDSLLDLHVSGVFPAADSAQFVRFLHERFGVTVTETDEEVRISGAAHK